MKKFKLELEPTKTKMLEFSRFAEADRKSKCKGKPVPFNFLGFTSFVRRPETGSLR